jgi:hypothetical protein
MRFPHLSAVALAFSAFAVDAAEDWRGNADMRMIPVSHPGQDTSGSDKVQDIY